MNTKVFKMPAMKDANIVKIAVEMVAQVPQLIEFNQKQPLAAIIQELCNGWGLSEPDQYALQFSESNNENYITEKNRNEIKNGSVLKLTQSPSTTAHDILQKLNNGTGDDKLPALTKLSKLSTDMTFALEFINKQGLALIISHIEGGKCKPGNTLAYSLISFVELMDHGIVSWDILESPFINKVASYVNNQAVTQDAKVVQASLSILENIVLNSSGKYGQVEKEVTFPNLVNHLQSQNPVIQQNAIALINALFLKADIAKRKAIAATLSSKLVRNVILTNIIQSSSGQVGTEMAYQLYVLQTLTLGLLEQRMNLKMDPQDQDAHDKIKELRRIAFDTDGTGLITDVTARKQLGVFAKDYKKLGFKYDINPALDFTETPPGMLALDCMVYFARNHTESYTKVVLENSCRADEHECPFGRTSVELVKLLCEVLRIGEPPNEQGQNYHPMFFTHDHPFEEFFCICIILLQVLTYSEITNLWQQERTNREEWESHARPIVELKEAITPEIMELIQMQRLNFMIEGTRFTKYSVRGQRIKDKFWYVRLSPNHKVFHYGDCDEKSVPTLEELPNKLAVVDIKALVVGKECPHMKDVSRDEQRKQLTRNKMLSKETENDLETLLSMDIKLRMLDAEGVDIPQDPPPIPADPPNYDFCYELK
ncbi:Engulfment and cell motility protein 1 [Blattella germanica]|nr:Engulfment and cell motility protein 1 [Blattella germanica]